MYVLFCARLHRFKARTLNHSMISFPSQLSSQHGNGQNERNRTRRGSDREVRYAALLSRRRGEGQVYNRSRKASSRKTETRGVRGASGSSLGGKIHVYIHTRLTFMHVYILAFSSRNAGTTTIFSMTCFFPLASRAIRLRPISLLSPLPPHPSGPLCYLRLEDLVGTFKLPYIHQQIHVENPQIFTYMHLRVHICMYQPWITSITRSPFGV